MKSCHDLGIHLRYSVVYTVIRFAVCLFYFLLVAANRRVSPIGTHILLYLHASGKEFIPLYIVCDVLETDRDVRALKSNTSEMQATETLFHGAENVFDTGAHASVGSVDPLRIGTERPALRRLLLNPILRPLGTNFPTNRLAVICLVRVDLNAAICGFVKQDTRDNTVVRACSGDLEAFYQFLFTRDLDVILVAEITFAVLFRPRRIAVSLPLDRRLLLPFRWALAFFEGFLLALAQMLLRCVDDTRIDNGSGLHQQACLPEHCLEGIEQFDDDAGLSELIAEMPNRLFVGHRITDTKTEKALKGKPVENHELRFLITQVIDTLQNQHLEHHDEIVTWPPTWTLCLLLQRIGNDRTENLPIHNRVEALKGISQFTGILQAMIFIEKTGGQGDVCALS